MVPDVGHAGLVSGVNVREIVSGTETGAPERMIALEGAVNFRDLGGYAADARATGRAGASCSGPTGSGS